MRRLLLLLYAANLALQYASWRLHPGRVAVHFGPGGRADGWGDSAAHSLGLSVLLTFFLIVFLGVPVWVKRLPAKWVNLPHRDYWLAPERRGEAQARLAGLLHRFGIVFSLFFLGVGGLVLQARSRAPEQLDQSLFLWLMVLLMGYVAAWLHAMWRAFPPPPR
jgi:hypothetical protein